MARRHRIGHAVAVTAVGFGLPLAGFAAPAQAAGTAPTATATRTTAAPTTQCQGLLPCVLPVVTGLTGTLVGTTVPKLVGTTVPDLVNAVPKVVGSVPQTLSTLLGAGQPTKPTTGTTTPPTRHHHGKPTITPTHPRTTPKTSVVHAIPKPATVVTPLSTTGAAGVPTIIPTAPDGSHNPVVNFVERVAQAATQVVTLFGWNLLALVPMAGIAFVISRRMAAARRSASGLL